MNNTALQIAELGFSYGDNRVLDGFSLHLDAGQFGCLLGHNGAGKSTLLRIVAGLEVPERGSVVLGGRTLNAPGQCVRAEQRRIGLVAQQDSLFPHLSVAGNIGFSMSHLTRSERQQKTEHWLQLVDMQRYADALPHQLSGGQRQRVALVRALASEPDLLLLDEPYSGLDSSTRRRLAGQLRSILAELSVTALMITHDWDEALAHSDRMGVMQRGALLQWDAPDCISNSPQHPETALFSGRAVLLAVQGQSDSRVRTAIGELRVRPASDGHRQVLVRREDIIMGSGEVTARVLEREYDGRGYRYRLALADEQLLLGHSERSWQRGESLSIAPADTDYLCYG